VNINILQRCKECMQGTFLASAMVLVGSVCDFLTCGPSHIYCRSKDRKSSHKELDSPKLSD
jgi:hypothetical protein